MLKRDNELALMRIFISESHRFGKKPLYEALVELFRLEGFAGATVLRGIMGFGAQHETRGDKLLRLNAELPIIVEVIDRQDKLDAILPQLDTMMSGGMVTIEKARVIRYYDPEGE